MVEPSHVILFWLKLQQKGLFVVEFQPNLMSKMTVLNSPIILRLIDFKLAVFLRDLLKIARSTLVKNASFKIKFCSYP